MTKFFICTVVVFAAIIMYTRAAVPGGLGDSKPVDAKVTGLINRLRADIIKAICDNAKTTKKGCVCSSKCPPANAKISINSYKTQVVAGTNYFVSVTISGIVYHVRIFVSLGGKTEEFKSVQGPKKASDKVSYFD